MDEAQRAQFVDDHWAALVQRVGGVVMQIADELWSKQMLDAEKYSDIKSANTSQKKMRELFDALHSGGTAVKSAFYLGLEQHAEHLLRDLEKENSGITQSAADHAESLERYKRWIQAEYEFVREYNSLPGVDVPLSERYTQPLIIMRHREKTERKEELCLMGENFQQLIGSRDNAEKDRNVSDALFGADNKGICPTAVILQGNSGKGKSFTAQKIMLDWASGNLGEKKFDCSFHLKCKELNCVSGKQSLVDLLSINSNLTAAQVLQILQKPSNRILVIIDGFDELRFSFSGTSNKSMSNNLSEKALPEDSLRALLRGRVLPDSFLLVTTRSTAADTLGSVLKKPQRFTEITGFSEREVDEYFQKFFQNEELCRNAYESVKANETLFTACSIPVICWIICTVIRERFSDSADVTSNLETTTSIYVDFVSTLLEHHCQGLSVSVSALLKSLGQLAERGMLEMQVLFDQKGVNEMVSEPAESPFLSKFLFKKRTRQETMFSFMHLSFQEFFTALFYISLDEKEFLSKMTERFHSHWQNCDVEYLDEKCPLKYGCPQPRFLPVVQFLCGLCNKEVSDSLRETHNMSVPPFIQAQLEEWILHISSERHYNFLPFILHCLYELHEKDFVQKAVEAWQEMDMSWSPLSRTDCWALLYCLECCPHFRSLNLSLGAEELKMLQAVLCRTPILELMVQNLSDTDIPILISALGEKKRLRELRLNSCGLSDQSLLQILQALRKQRTVGGLQVVMRNISADTVLMLTDFLQSSEKWEEISLKTSAACSLCSSLQLFHFDGNLVLKVERRSGPENIPPSLSEIILKFPHSEMSSVNLKDVLQIFHNINHPNQQSAGSDQQVDVLLSLLSSVSGLRSINLSAPVLYEKWASRILLLIRSCSSLAGLSFNAGSSSDGGQWLPGVLTEEGVRLLKESIKSPQCALHMKGFRCSKSSDCCTQMENLDCNKRVSIRISGEDFTEEIFPQVDLFVDSDKD